MACYTVESSALLASPVLQTDQFYTEKMEYTRQLSGANTFSGQQREQKATAGNKVLLLVRLYYSTVNPYRRKRLSCMANCKPVEHSTDHAEATPMHPETRGV